MSDGLDPENGQIVTAIGWGKDSDESDGLSRLLREVNIPIMDNFDCNSVYGNVNDGNICTDSTGGKGICSVCVLINHYVCNWEDSKLLQIFHL